jgi:SH3-like domain-containing protein
MGMSGRTQDQILRLHVLAVLAGLLALAPFAAGGQVPATDKVPRFASLRSDEVNLRVGPGENYPIEWVLKRKDMPVEILEEFQNWRKVQDSQGDKGWVLDRMVSARRDVVVVGATRALYRQPDPGGQIIARAEPGVVARLIELQGAWCHVEAGGFQGWVQRSEVWGVFPDETLQ